MSILIDRRTPHGRLLVRKDEHSGDLRASLSIDRPPAIGTTIRPVPGLHPNACEEEFTHTIGDGNEGGTRVALLAREVVAIVNAEPAGLELEARFLDSSGDGHVITAASLGELADAAGTRWPIFLLGLRGSIAVADDDDGARFVFQLGAYVGEDADRATYNRILSSNTEVEEEALLRPCFARLRAAGYNLAPFPIPQKQSKAANIAAAETKK